MSLCTFCGLQISGEDALCRHHHAYDEPEEAASNRVMCDLIHRGIVPRRLSLIDRADPVTDLSQGD